MQTQTAVLVREWCQTVVSPAAAWPHGLSIKRNIKPPHPPLTTHNATIGVRNFFNSHNNKGERFINIINRMMDNAGERKGK